MIAIIFYTQIAIERGVFKRIFILITVFTYTNLPQTICGNCLYGLSTIIVCFYIVIWISVSPVIKTNTYYITTGKVAVGYLRICVGEGEDRCCYC